jgi:DNA polymerase-3 subunit chi
MSRVDFYVLENAAASARERFACKLAEKAYKLGHRIVVRAADDQHKRQLDELLWTFRPGSFVPHGTDPADANTPVLIATQLDADLHYDVLINLNKDLPPATKNFERIAEVIDQTDEVKTGGRHRFKQYREQGLDVSSHRING